MANHIAARVAVRYGHSLLGDLQRELGVAPAVFAEMTIPEVKAALERTVWCADHKGHRVAGCNACNIFIAQGV